VRRWLDLAAQKRCAPRNFRALRSALANSAGETAVTEEERRTSARQRTVLRGTVYYDKRSVAADCLVRDLSDGGARLELSENVIIPDTVELYIPKKEETFHAQVRWRNLKEVGVAYVNGRNGGRPNDEEVPANGHKGSDLRDRMQKLEAEIVSLKRTIKNLEDDMKMRLRLPL
jgi:hypothetical protein